MTIGKGLLGVIHQMEYSSEFAALLSYAEALIRGVRIIVSLKLCFVYSIAFRYI